VALNQRPDSSAAWSPGGRCLRSLAHIMGTSVRDTTAEMRIVTASVTANSRNKRPTTSCMKSSGMSTAISDTVREMMVKPIWPAPLSAASRSEEHTSELQSHRDLHSFPTRRSSDLDHILHEKQRNEHRDQRHGQGNDGEADLAGALERRFEIGRASCRERV